MKQQAQPKSLEYLMNLTSEQIVDLYRQHFAERDPERAALLKLEADFANLHWVNSRFNRG